jgi:hypothetical protein
MSTLSRFPDNWLTDGSEAVSLMPQLAALYPQKDSWYSFLLDAESKSYTITKDI